MGDAESDIGLRSAPLPERKTRPGVDMFPVLVSLAKNGLSDFFSSDQTVKFSSIYGKVLEGFLLTQRSQRSGN